MGADALNSTPPLEMLIVFPTPLATTFPPSSRWYRTSDSTAYLRVSRRVSLDLVFSITGDATFGFSYELRLVAALSYGQGGLQGAIRVLEPAGIPVGRASQAPSIYNWG